MLPTQEHIDHIRQRFAAMSSKEDFLALLNYTKKLAIGENAKPFELKQVTFYANPKISGKRYTKFEIKKKSGGVRTIHAPVKGLSIIQRCLNLILQCLFTPHIAATGFTPNKSIVDNARVHVGRNYVYNIDLKDFFPSVDQARVWKCLQLPPFNLIDDKVSDITAEKLLDNSKSLFIMISKKLESPTNELPEEWFNLLADFIKETTQANKLKKLNELKQIFITIINNQKFPEPRVRMQRVLTKWWNELTSGRLEIANMIAALCCTEMEVERIDDDGKWKLVNKNVLPQGAATSPIITNIICQRLDHKLTGVAKRFGLKYTRYADDISFSAQHNVFQPNGKFIAELRRIIAEQKFHIKESKVRLQQSGFRQEVTGLIVNKTVNINQKYVKQLRMWIYYWEHYGYDKAYNYFVSNYIANITKPLKGKPDMANVIGGKLDYLKMVKGIDNPMYLKLKDRFETLVNYSRKKEDISHLDLVLSRLLSNGLDDAMSIYNANN